ncbi:MULTISPECIES: sugar ABC transporter substrate-binding protein [unclassified Microbacterium]|uniref:sugar ABC transporter substrate-binding protein n=1 Tax=unclassified Microbacterium TaxID=2609290 RepID=UPI0004939CB4|nr:MULTISPECIES: extracellular solute-binding protein [unclassified Microbacterium]MCV0333893.1 extracellular solute-binding protein [Microbacterium sp.]MCV0374579.1 extracellular solute-binding protein [Microbacterium sp.]MCV0389651.1 extracellular solute-binding protein [Microbacterium sp.]MCV0419186.1 extracellular solute-binding protein [Microbacterium sp.]MCV0421491.1 extracellular solute-binding protein [Microbacterium sp.]
MKVNKRGIVAAGAIAIVSTLTLAGCSTGTSSDDTSGSDDSGKLVVWVDAERVDALQGAADAYQEKTGVKVELTGKSVDDMKDDFIQQVPTGKGPDIVMGAHDWLGELSTNGVVAPIELGDSSEDYLPVALQAATYDGTVYMLPYAVENIAVLRNADLVPAAATSFDDMVSKGTFVVEQGTEGNPYHLYPFQTAFGAPVFGTDDTGSYDSTDLQLGSEGGFAFADWLGAQGAAGVLNTDVDGEIAKQQFLDGTAAFWLTGPWNVGAATDAGINVAIDPIPSPTGETASPFAGVKGFFVSSESKNKVAANDFLVNYIGTEDVQLELFKAGNVLPALTAAADTAAADPIIAGFQAVGADAVPMPAIPAMGAVWQYWGVAEAAIINGEDPTTTWQKLVDDVTAAIK